MSRINNWRVGLSWPAIKEEMPDVEYLYEDEAGKTHSNFSSENALAAMMIDGAVFLNTYWWEKEWPEAAKKTVALCVNTNDVFAWGVADAETIGHGEIEAVYRYWVKDRRDGTSVWACIRSKQMPQRPVENAIRKAGIWDLDALRAEHGLRANHYDGISAVFADMKREVYVAWCREKGVAPLPYDGGWWDGWKAYVAENPGWRTKEWEVEEKRRCNEWRSRNGYEEET